MIDLHPKICNLCGGEVIFTTNDNIYGRKYGSGWCYYCTNCGAYVGTHKPRPSEALGILANAEMRELKVKCHEIFDKKWKESKTRHHSRDLAYSRLAKKMGIPVEDCHFGYMNLEQLKKAYQILTEGK